MFFSKSKNVLGIDIGTSHIKAVELKPDSPRPFLASYGIVNVMLPQSSDGKLDTIEQIAEVIKSLHEKAKFTTKRAVVSLPSNVAFVSVFDFPKMSEEELGRAVEYKAKQFIPLPLSDVNFSWQIVGESKIEKSGEKSGLADADKVKVLLTAVPKNVVNNYANVMQKAGLEPVAIEIESISAIRALIDPNEKGAVLIVDVGAKATILSLSLGGYLHGSRQISVGGDAITSSIAKSLGISYERAEKLKYSADTNGQDTSAAQAAKNVVDLVRGEAQQLIKISENQGKPIERIILSGGGAKYPVFRLELESFNIPVADAEPLKRVSYGQELNEKLSAIGLQLPIAVGLALRGIE